jgi:hypothetical protein
MAQVDLSNVKELRVTIDAEYHFEAPTTNTTGTRVTGKEENEWNFSATAKVKRDQFGFKGRAPASGTVREDWEDDDTTAGFIQHGTTITYFTRFLEEGLAKERAPQPDRNRCE